MLKLDNKNLRLIAGALFVFLLGLSLVLYFVTMPWNSQVLFFPEMSTGKLVGERRFLPFRQGIGAQIERYVQELILGPSDPLLMRIVPKDVRLHSVVVRQGKVYLSLSRDILDLRADARLTFDQTLQAIANGVLYNFPQVRSLHILVDGQLPGENHADGFVFVKNLLK